MVFGGYAGGAGTAPGQEGDPAMPRSDARTVVPAGRIRPARCRRISASSETPPARPATGRAHGEPGGEVECRPEGMGGARGAASLRAKPRPEGFRPARASVEPARKVRSVSASNRREVPCHRSGADGSIRPRSAAVDCRLPAGLRRAAACRPLSSRFPAPLGGARGKGRVGC